MDDGMSTTEIDLGPTTHYELTDPKQGVEFDGWLLAHVTSESPNYPRWTTMDLYQSTTGAYAVMTVGHTVVYHAADSTCNSVDPIDADELPEDAEPCANCRPSRTPMGLVKMEQPRPTLYKCRDADAVRKAVSHFDRDKGTVVTSVLAQRLLIEAAKVRDVFSPANNIEQL
jgi:hypothetical protein